MPDPGWAARPPEANDLLLKTGTGVATMLANQTAWTALGASHHASAAASMINTGATSMSWLGAGSMSSAVNVTLQNAALHGLAGWVDVKPAVVASAISAYEMANAAMRPAPECNANRDEQAADNLINPAVLWTLTPRIISLDTEYFGVMWPNNSAVGASYGAILAGLAESLAIVPPLATMGASPAAPAEAAAAIGQAAGDAVAGDAMRAAYQGASGATSGPSAGAQDIGSQVGTFMGPMQSMLGAVPQALQAPSGLMQAPMSALQPASSMMGMFANPGALGMGGALPASTASAASAASGAAGGVGGGGPSLGGAGVPATSFTRPVSAFEPAGGGRPVGLRPSAALGAEALRAPTTTTASGTGVGGMPMGYGAGSHGGSHGKNDKPATVRVIDDRQ
jgi:hypothetical protein